MWLLNHGTARKFEVPMLKRIGFSEIFLPKVMPPSFFRSGSVDFSEDASLTIPAKDLAAMNAVNWYGRVRPAIWDLANRHFRVLFFIAHDPTFFANVADNFQGTVVWRAYGLDQSSSYSKRLRYCSGGLRTIEKLAGRFWFGEAYDHLHESEEPFLQSRAVFLPLGFASDLTDSWSGEDRRIFFVCPEIGNNRYYRNVYIDFKKSFRDLPHLIAGPQPLAVDDPCVAGYVPLGEHVENMRRLRVMYYHSTEPNHVHYHPFEAIKVGMPLVFRGGGLLDRLGGRSLPGRAESVIEARSKIERILNGDKNLTEEIRRTQKALLEPMSFEAGVPHWRDGFTRILSELRTRSERPSSVRRKRIAVILPHIYRGGTLRGAKLTAEALLLGSRQCGKEVEVVFAHRDDSGVYARQDFSDLPAEVSVRPFHWSSLSRAEARRAMLYEGHCNWTPTHNEYGIPDDGVRQFGDCDLWLFISDRLTLPLLPIRRFVVLAYDYLQRYVPLKLGDLGQTFIQNTRAAERVLVTTGFTKRDAIQFAGIDPDRVIKVPMLAPDVSMDHMPVDRQEAATYFVWTTNSAPHKNHIAAFEALQVYYETLGGTLHCRIIGPDSKVLLSSDASHLRPLASIYGKSKVLQDKLEVLGELSDSHYCRSLAKAAFLWHPATIDNGTFSVIEAAKLGVPSLSSDYPAMRDIDSQFGLSLSFMDRGNPRDMADKLKWMEQNFAKRRDLLPSAADLATQTVERLAAEYWEAVSPVL
jgi:glycosyltransferase involved in cell wall biosynthesis